MSSSVALMFLTMIGSTFAFDLARAATVTPPNFAVDDAAPGAGFVVPTGMAFMPDGRFFVTEKRGRVYEVRGGIKQAIPTWAGENEVLDQHDRGLLGIAVDPNYFVNHFIYLLYTVDPDSNGNDTNDDAFSRLTRYQVNFTDSASVIASSRTILMGYNWTNGPVSASPSHTIGSLEWGRDGSLILSSGDGAQYDFADGGGSAGDAGAFGAGKTDPNENIGAFRAQDITSLCGKILRINPANGHGYASNPFANGNLASVQSRVYAYGVRNPFRIGVRPNTGVADTSAGSPGSIYIGDVGWNSYEEMNVARSGGKNFGWPCYEGLTGNSTYQALNPPHNGCGSFGTATNPSIASAPITSWSHGIPTQSDPAGFTGNTSIGGTFYTSNQYPAQYRNQYFFADYGQNWIKVCVMDANDNRLQLLDFATSADGPVDLASNPVTGDIFYVSILTGQVRRIRYTGVVGGNTPPIAAINAAPTLGAAPLTVNFNASGSFDPDGDPITYSWLFGDGTSATGINPSHVYSTFGLMSAQLTVSDSRGGQGVTTATITVNPPGTGFPTTGVLDNFNRPNGAIGAPWVDATSGLVITSNVLTSTNVTNSTVWNGGSFARNQEAYFTITSATNAPEQNLMLKVQGTSWASGHIEVHYGASAARIYVNTYAAAQGWVGRGSVAGSFVTGDQFGARADSLGNVSIYKNGVSLGQVSVAGWTYVSNGGSIGITLSGINTTGGSIDNFGGGSVTVASNTKPVATIIAPANNSFYYAGQTIDLSGTASDAQTASNLLTYQWTLDLYHNNHIHPSVYTFNGPTASFTGENHDDGTGVHMLIKLVATDPQGFRSDTAFAAIWPENDLQPGVVTVTPSSPSATQSVPIGFFIRNTGRMPTPISHWMLRAGNLLIAQGDVIVPALDSVAVNVSAAFPNAGTFTLRLTADSLNTDFETNESNNASVRSITVNPVPGNNPPVAVAGGVPVSGNAPLLVAFSAAGSSDIDGDPLGYAWAFGDASNGSGASPSHTYAAAGTYVAILTVTDGRGGSDTASVVITANTPPNTFPQTVVLDNFNRANGAIGGSWVDGTVGLTINNNQLQQATQPDNSFVWNGATFGATQEIFVTMSTVNNAAPEQNLMLKVQGTSWSAGHIEIAYNGPQSRIAINTYAPSQGWQGRGQITGVSFANGDRFGARTDAAGNIEVYRNTTKLATVSAGNWPFVTSGGRLGMTLASTGSTGRFDDFGGGTVTGAPVPQPDLQVSAVTVAPDPATATQNSNYSFKLYNRGNANAAASHWVLRAGASLLGQGDVAINAGDSTALNLNAAIATAGSYAVRLTADSLGAVIESNESNNSSVRTLTVNPVPGNNPPVAVADGSPQTGQAPITVNFTAAGSSDIDGDPLTYTWAFGDGGTGSGLTLSHLYGAGGTYAAVLTVTDGRGGSDTASVPVTLTSPPNSFPQTAVLDNFNRANGAIGGSWVDGTAGLTINANQLAQTVSDNTVVWNGATFGATQEIFITMSAVNNAAPEQNLMLKVQGTSWSSGHIEIAYNGPQARIVIHTYAPTQGWINRGQVTGITFASGDRFGARADVAGNIEIYRNSTKLATVSAGNWPFAASGGRLGLTLSGTGSSTRFDDFGGGTVPGTAPLAALDPARETERLEAALPGKLELSSAFPNPAKQRVSLSLDLPREADVSLSIFDVQGREVWQVAEEHYGAGHWLLRWDGLTYHGPATAGLYLARVKVGGETFMRRMALVR